MAKVHFIGIGGIGMSALAQYYLAKGNKVSGSDLVSSEITWLLKKKGAKIFIGHKISNLKWQKSNLHLKTKNSEIPDLVVYSSAVSPDNNELKAAKKLGVRCQSYPQILGKLTEKYWTIAIAGTHGKSTTTAMIANILSKAGFDPTVIIGTKLKEFGDSNFRLGKSKYLVIEADEWKAGFLNYWPKIIVLTSIEKEHLDYYRNLRHILKTYQEFIDHLPKKGALIANADDENIRRIINFKYKTKNEKLQFKIKNYTLAQKETRKLREILKVPGEHNIANALSALTTARALKISDEIIYKALAKYKGAWRRFEEKNLKLKSYNLKLISDYAHHPTEIAATLKAARERFPKKEIWVIFQPHQYQRTFYLFDEFVKVFKKAPINKLIITDIYDVAGREEKKIKGKVSAEKLALAVIKEQKAGNKKQEARKRKQETGSREQETVFYLPFCLKGIANYLKSHLKGGEVVIVMGAGDIYKLVNTFLKK